MKKIIMYFVIFLFAGCAFAPVSARIGEQTGKMYVKAYERGTPSAEQIKTAWPFISGLIKGTFNELYEYTLSTAILNTVKSLDELCAKETLTDEERGQIIGNVNRLEYLAAKELKISIKAIVLSLF